MIETFLLLDLKKRLGQNNIPVSSFAKNNQIIACNFYSINAFQKSESSM